MTHIRNAVAGMCRLWRANVGTAWTGDVERINAHDIIIRNARPFSTGLPPGFPDLFGILTVKITPEMVGQEVGVFIGAEVKTPKGRATDKQLAFGKAVVQAGGRWRIVRSPEDMLQLIGKDLIS